MKNILGGVSLALTILLLVKRVKLIQESETNLFKECPASSIATKSIRHERHFLRGE